MTIVFFDGFDTYKTGVTDAYNNGISLTEQWNCGDATTLTSSYMTIVQGGKTLPGTPTGQYLMSSNTNSSSNRLFASINPVTTICVGFHYSPTVTIGNNNNIVTMYNTGAATAANVVQLVTGGSNYLQILAGGNTYTSAGKPLVLDIWTFIEVQLTFTGRSVTGNVYSNGLLILTFTEPTALSATASFQNINAVSIGKNSAWTTAGVIQRYDNFYITDGEQLGEIFIPAFVPSVNPTSTAWLANSGDGTNYTMINDLGSNDSMVSNVVSNTVGDKDIYRLNIPTTLAAIAGNVKAVSTFMQASGSTLGTTGVNAVMRNTTTDTVVSTVDLEANRNSQFSRSAPLVNKPSNNTAWTVADLQNLRVGIESKNYASYTTPYLLSSGANGVITNKSRTNQLAVTGVPTVTGNYLQFNGTNTMLSYNRTSADGQLVWQFAPPFSIEFDMILASGTYPSVSQWIMTFGRTDTNAPYGELVIAWDARGLGCYFQPASGGNFTGPFSYQFFANGSNGATATSPTNPVSGQSYKYGLMLYSDMTTVYIRGYLDGVQRFQAPVSIGYLSSATALSIGGSVDYGSTSRFNGQIANLRMDDSLFWAI